MQLDSLELDDQFEWVDEFDWSVVEQESERSLGGQLLVQGGHKIYGRPITLASNGGVWTTLETVRALEVLRDQFGRIMPLTLPDGREFSVIFNHEAGAPLQCVPIERKVNPSLDALYEITVRLLTVEPPAEAPPAP